MPTVACPHCRQPHSTHASPQATLVRCAACGQPFTVPAAGEPAANSEPFAGLHEEPETGEPRAARRRGGGSRKQVREDQTVVLVVGSFLVLAAALFIFIEVRSGIDSRRVPELADQHIDLVLAMLRRHVEIGVSKSTYDDPEYKALFNKDYYVVEEHTRILERHPSWNAKRLKVGPPPIDQILGR